MNKVEEDLAPLTDEMKNLRPGQKFRFIPDGNILMIIHPANRLNNFTMPSQYLNLETGGIYEVFSSGQRVFLVRSVTITEED